MSTENKKGGDIMRTRIIIGFQTNKDFKDRVVDAGKNMKIKGVDAPVNLSMFCRIAVSRLVNEVEQQEEGKE